MTQSVPDAALLNAFCATRADAAFAELVRRHGPLVEGACRRVLAGHPDADDAYQATFLVLARRARELRDPDRLAPWLYGVAVRCARRARGRALARRETRLSHDPPAPPEAPDWSDALAGLDAELGRLPARFRTALVLCELQGVGRAEAARRLGVPEGTLSSRVARAKARLRLRLVDRGLTLSAAAVTSVLAEASAAGLAKPVAGTPSAAAIALAQAEVPTMTGSVVSKLLLMLLTALGLSAAGVWLAAPPIPDTPEPPGAVDPAEAADLEAMQGKWQLVKLLGNGPVEPGTRDKPTVVTAAGNSLALLEGYQCEFVIYPNESPKQIDLTMRASADERGKSASKLEGIYRFNGDSLVLALAFPTGDDRRRVARPNNFDSVLTTGDGLVQLITLRRPGSVAPAPPRPRVNVASEKLALQGEWQTVAVLSPDSLPKPTKAERTARLRITANRLYFTAEGDGAKYVIYPNEDPPQIDLAPTVSERDSFIKIKIEGVYRLDGDTLTLHYCGTTNDNSPGPRPTGFVPDAKYGSSVRTLKRVKK